ncbi:hypothetical protein H4582DRAFT_1899401 [Lactarius indigo]|nr:hypothetical protein H4582DRAFT_1899401 [Lactarius indigo]
MGPRPSISGELPIDSYFSSLGRTMGPSGSKDNRSFKRKNALDAAESDAERTSTKKLKTKTPSKGSQARHESKTDHTRSKGVSSTSRTTSMPTPNSMTKQSLPPSVLVSLDADVISTVSSPMQTVSLSPRVTVHPSSENSSGGFGLPTPKTVSHGSKTRSRADSASCLHSVTASRSVAQSGPSVRSPFPQTPTRSKSKIDSDYTAPLNTPHSQRIVPSSQCFADEQISSLEDGRDPFLLHPTKELDRCSEDLAPPSLFKLPPYPPSRVPAASSSSLPSASISSNGCSSLHRSQNSQIEPTSQFEEIELRFSSDSQAGPPPVHSPQAKHDRNASSIKRLELDLRLPQKSKPRPIDNVTQESDIHHTHPHPPPSPLTPLTPSSPRVPDIECEKLNSSKSDGQPLHEIPSMPLSPEPVADTQRGKATPLSKLDVPVEDPTSDEDENFVVHPSPVRRRSVLQNPSPPSSFAPSASTRSHLRISHAKLRSLPAVNVELNSEGEEMSSPGTSIGAFPPSPGASCLASSYLDLNETLPSEVEDFLDMVGTNASSGT